jgi:transcriptional regulator with XRE-family HTH domain
MGVKERLREFIKFKRISERAFCREVGVSMSYVNSIRTSIQPDKMKAIAEKYPDLNPMWLLTGEPEGGMLLNGNNNQINGNGNTAVAGNGNRVTTNDIAGMIELQKGYQTMIKEKDDQINRLISVIEKLSER